MTEVNFYNSPPNGVWSPDHPACSELPYRLHYSNPLKFSHSVYKYKDGAADDMRHVRLITLHPICNMRKSSYQILVEQKWNMMAHAQKPDLVFQRNGRVHLYRRGCQFSQLLAAEVSASAGVMLDRPYPIRCTTAGYPLHSPFSPSLLHPFVSALLQLTQKYFNRYLICYGWLH